MKEINDLQIGKAGEYLVCSDLNKAFTKLDVMRDELRIMVG